MLTLTQMCQLSGLSRRTLQGYDEMGLLRHCGATPGGYWLYDDSAVDRLAVIQLLRQAGFSRKETHSLLPEEGLPLEETLTALHATLLERRHLLDQLLECLDPAKIRQHLSGGDAEQPPA